MTAQQIGPHLIEFTKHSLERALDMDLKPRELTNAILGHEVREGSRRYPGTVYWDHGRVTLSVAPMANGTVKILTILWRTEEGWRQDYRKPAYDGRAPRADPFRPDVAS